MKIGNEEIKSYMTLKFEFAGVRIIGNLITPTKWKMKVNVVAIEHKGDDISQIQQQGSLAYSKLLFWLDVTLPSCIVIDVKNTFGMEIANNSENIMLFCPDEPTDDLLIELIHAKLSTIVKSDLHIGEIQLESEDTPAAYTFNLTPDGYRLPVKTQEYFEYASLHKMPWWFRSDGFSFELFKPKGCKEKLSELYKHIEDPLLAFDSTMELELSYSDTEKQPAKIIQVDRWKPTKV